MSEKSPTTNPSAGETKVIGSARISMPAEKNDRAPLPPQARAPRVPTVPQELALQLSPAMRALVSEAGWLTMGVAGLFTVMILMTHHHGDATWARPAGTAVRNWGGAAGASISEALLAFFGYSSWWLVGLLGQLAVRTYLPLSERLRRNGEEGAGTAAHHRPHQMEILLRAVSFALLLAGSSSLEHLAASAFTPHVADAQSLNTLGALLSHAIVDQFGTVGATMLFALMLTTGLSVHFHFSWIVAATCVVQSFLRLVERIDNFGFRTAEDGVAADDAATAEPESAPTARTTADALPDPSGGAPEPLSARLASSLEARSLSMAAAREQLAATLVLPAAAPPPPDQGAEPVLPVSDANHGERTHVALLPPLALLDAASTHSVKPSEETIAATGKLIEAKLGEFGVVARIVGAYPGPVITRYEIDPASGVKGSQIATLARDLARSLSLTSLRVVEVIPGKNCMGLELPNPKRDIVRLTEIIGSAAYRANNFLLPVALGKDIAGQPVVADLAKMPHLLVAGTTGSGKSVGINATILSLLYKADPADVRLILIDPKMLELSVYEGIPHLLTPVVTDMRLAANALNWAVTEMDRRYRLMSTLGVRNLLGFNEKIAAAAAGESLPNPFSLTPDAPEPLAKLPSIVIVIDELADLMMVAGKKVEELIARIAQKARAAGLHLILATQRPSVDVITGLIKANVPTRIAFQVSSKIDSRTILDQMGAESLLGMGDMLYLPPGSGSPIRVHGAFVSDDEVHRIVGFLKQQGEPDYVTGIVDGGGETGSASPGGAETEHGAASGESDEMYNQAVMIVREHNKASISLVQRHLRIGYNRAARLLEQMEAAGVVTAMTSAGNREICAAPHHEA